MPSHFQLAQLPCGRAVTPLDDGSTITVQDKIKKLTATELILENEKGMVEVYQRVKDEGQLPPVPGVGKFILNKRGRLTSHDPQREFKPHKPFQISLTQGKIYVIDLKSAEMDSYLILYDPMGVKVAQDDDGGGNTDARIRYQATKSGNYLVAATCFKGVPPGGAAFSLTVREE